MGQPCCASLRKRSSTSTAHPALRADPPCSASAATTGNASPRAHARILWSVGLRPGDCVIIAAVFSLYIGSWGALMGAERLGARCFPFGAGAPGQTERALEWIGLVKPVALYGTPSYALYLAEVAKGMGYDPRRDFSFKLMFFSGEPGASVPSTRKEIEQTYGCYVVDQGTMAELTPWMDQLGLPPSGAWDARVDRHSPHRAGRPENQKARALRRRRCARVHPSGAHLSASRPVLVGRPGAMGYGGLRVWTHLSHANRGLVWQGRRHDHGAGPERISPPRSRTC